MIVFLLLWKEKKKKKSFCNISSQTSFSFNFKCHGLHSCKNWDDWSQEKIVFFCCRCFVHRRRNCTQNNASLIVNDVKQGVINRAIVDNNSKSWWIQFDRLVSLSVYFGRKFITFIETNVLNFLLKYNARYLFCSCKTLFWLCKTLEQITSVNWI